MRKAVVPAVSVIFLLSLAATAQESRSEFSLQGAGFFTSSVSGNGTAYSATESGGVIGTYRYHLNHWISAEASYGYNRDTQKYQVDSEAFRIQSSIHQFTASFVFNLLSRPHSRVTPYFLMGGGVLLFAPTGDQFNSLSNTQSQAKGAFLYGLGVNYAIHKGIALRAEYRGLVYGPPNFGFGALTANAVTQTAEPSIGISFRF
jgi:opacity protein-like surface antigen